MSGSESSLNPTLSEYLSPSFSSHYSTKSLLHNSTKSTSLLSCTSSNVLSSSSSKSLIAQHKTKAVAPLRWDSTKEKFIPLGFPAIKVLWYFPNFTVVHKFPFISFPDIVGGRLITVLVKSIKKSDKGIEYEIGLGKRMEAIYADYSNRLDCEASAITLYYMGRPISPHDTPEAFTQRGNEIIYAIAKEPNMNTDTHVKLFTVEEMVTKGWGMTYIADKLDGCKSLYYAWAEYLEVDPCRIYLVYKSFVLEMDRTIESAKIKNNSRVLAMEMQPAE